MVESPNSICPLKFWIWSSRPLQEIADALLRAGVLGDYCQDCENAYEWFTCTPLGYDVELNVSRKHQESDLDFDEPLAFLIIARDESTPPESIVRELAAAVQTAMKTTVYLGTIEYLGNDEFRYTVRETLTA
jgi:hypothetical protein